MFTADGYPELAHGFRLSLEVSGLRPTTIRNYTADARKFVEHYEALSDFDDLDIVIYEPDSRSSEARVSRSTEVPKMTAGKATLVGLIHRYLGGLLDPFVTLLEVHKLMYFMQAAGEPLRLSFTKRPFGPYAENLRHEMNRIEGHMISGYGDGGDAPDKQLELVPGALDDARAFLKNRSVTQTRFEKVGDLVDGFESPFGLELLSTVHWIVSNEQVRSVDDVVKRTYAWNDRKKQFSRRQIELAVNVLSRKGWFTNLNAPRPAWPPPHRAGP